MFDYKSLEALSAVIDLQSFDLAAEKLFITQSAISQRIKALEHYFGQPLLIRDLPYIPTELGQLLLNHYRKTKLLEDDTRAKLSSHIERTRLSIAINRDSLDIWFPAVFKPPRVTPVCAQHTQPLLRAPKRLPRVPVCGGPYAPGCKGRCPESPD